MPPGFAGVDGLAADRPRELWHPYVLETVRRSDCRSSAIDGCFSPGVMTGWNGSGFCSASFGVSFAACRDWSDDGVSGVAVGP